MATDAEVQVLITARDLASAAFVQVRQNVQRFASALGATEQEGRRAGATLDTLRRSVRDFAAASHSGLAPLLAAGGLAGLSGALVATGIGFDSLREQALISFDQILGGGQKALAFFNQLSRVAAETPFQQSDVIQMGQRLVVVGYDAERATSLVRLFSDVVSSIPNAGSEQLDSITRSFARMRESGVAGLGEIETLSAQGIPALQILAEQFGTNTRAMRRILMRELPADMIMARLEAGLRARFGGMGARQVDTFRGVLSNIRDIVTQDLGQVMLPFFVSLRDTLRTIVRGLADLKLWFQQLPQPVKDVIKQLSPLALLLVPLGVGLGIISAAVSGFVAAFGVVAGILGPVLVALEPFAPLLALIAIAAYTLYLAWTQNWFGIRDALIAAWGVIQPILAAVWDFLVKLGTGQITLSVVLGAGWDWVKWLAGQMASAGSVAWTATLGLLGAAWDTIKWLGGLAAGVLKFAVEGWLKVFGLGWDDVEWLMEQAATATQFAWNAAITLVGEGWVWVRWLAGQVAAAASVAWNTTVSLVAGGWEWVQWLAGQIASAASPAWDTAITLLAGGWDWVVWLAGQATAPIAPVFGAAMQLVGDLVNGAWGWVTWLWDVAASGFTSTFSAAMQLVGDLVNGAWGWVTWLWDVAAGGFTATFSAAMQLAGDLVNGPWGWVQWLWTVAANGFTATFKASVTLLGDAWDWIKRLWSGFTGHVGAALGGGGGATGFVNGVPQAAEGGITRGTGLAYLHPMEAIIPLDRLPGAGGGGGLTVNVTVNGPLLGTDLEDVIAQQIDNLRRRARITGLA